MSDDDDVPRDTSPPADGDTRRIDLADWLTLADAMTTLGVSKRTVERLAHTKRLERRLRPQARGPAVAVYNPEDAARVASERRAAPAPFVLHANPDGNGHHLTRAAGGGDLLREFLGALVQAVAASTAPPSSPVAKTVAEKPALLTIAEAAAELRVDECRIERLIQTKRLPIVKLSMFRVDRRIRRKDLEAL